MSGTRGSPRGRCPEGPRYARPKEPHGPFSHPGSSRFRPAPSPTMLRASEKPHPTRWPRPFHRVLGLGLVSMASVFLVGGAVDQGRGRAGRTDPGDREMRGGSGEAAADALAPAGGGGPVGSLTPEAETQVVKLLPFLAPGARADLQEAAARHVLALTGSGPGRTLLAGQAELLRALAELAAAPAPAPARDAARAFVNLAADPCLHESLLAAAPGLPARLLGRALDPQWPWAEEAAAVLANLSREPAPCASLMEALTTAEPGEAGLERLVHALCTPGYNARAPLHYLGPVLSNLSQRPAARAFLLDPDRCAPGGPRGGGSEQGQH